MRFKKKVERIGLGFAFPSQSIYIKKKIKSFKKDVP